MEYVTGGSLSEHLYSKNPLSPWEWNMVLCQGLQGLSHLHDHDVAHRDIKPDNMLIDFRQQGMISLKWADFGLAKQGLKFATQCGTWQYAAPDVFAEIVSYDKGADVWSLGVVIIHGKTLGWPEWAASRREAGLGWCQALVGFATKYDAEVNSRQRSDRNEATAKLIGLVTHSLLKTDPAQRSSAKECLQEGKFGHFDPFSSFVGIEDDGSRTPTQNNQSCPSMGSGSWDKVFEEALIERNLNERETNANILEAKKASQLMSGSSQALTQVPAEFTAKPDVHSMHRGPEAARAAVQTPIKVAHSLPLEDRQGTKKRRLNPPGDRTLPKSQ